MPWIRTLCVFLLVTSAAIAEDWPQWLGPRRNASSSERVQPWKGKLKILWQRAVGEGHSSPIVANGKVYLHTRNGNAEEEILRAFDAKTGKPLWGKSYPRRPYKGQFGNGPRATPAVSGGFVFTYGITGMLACFDAESGALKWKKDVEKDFNAPKLVFGTSCSPLVDKEKVYINVGANRASIVAFHRKNGKIVWKALNDTASYSSPISYGKGKNKQLIFFTGAGLVALDPADGDLHWRYAFKDLLAESSTTPVFKGKFLLASAITRGSLGLTFQKSPTVKPVKTWYKSKLTSYFSTPVFAGNHLYMVTGRIPVPFVSPPQATLHCINPKTGKVLWTKPNVGKFHASLMLTNGKLLMLEEAGDLVLLEPNPKRYQELSRAKICGKTWAHAALSNGRLYVRDERFLTCVKLK